MKAERTNNLKRSTVLAFLALLLMGRAASANSYVIHDVDGIKPIALDDKEPYDPGKEITDNPHGPGTHGPNPHGPDPYDEVHDKKLPANDKDNYGPNP
jgi:hypothetical protein